MSKFIKIKNGKTTITINTDYLVNIQKISNDTMYVDYYASDATGKCPSIIDRAEVYIGNNNYYESLINQLHEENDWFTPVNSH